MICDMTAAADRSGLATLNSPLTKFIMVHVPDEKLKLTIRPETQEYEGLEIVLSEENLEQTQSALQKLSTLEKAIEGNRALTPVLQIFQSKILEQAYGNGEGDIDFNLEHENGSALRVEVFEKFEPQSCSSEQYEHRAKLKVSRTIMNLRELIDLYPVNSDLSELVEILETLDKEEHSASELNKKIRQITQMPMFNEYLESKNSFLNDWVEEQKENSGKNKEGHTDDSIHIKKGNIEFAQIIFMHQSMFPNQ